MSSFYRRPEKQIVQKMGNCTENGKGNCKIEWLEWIKILVLVCNVPKYLIITERLYLETLFRIYLFHPAL